MVYINIYKENKQAHRKMEMWLGKGETLKTQAKKVDVKIDKQNNKTGKVTSLRFLKKKNMKRI